MARVFRHNKIIFNLIKEINYVNIKYLIYKYLTLIKLL